MNQIIIGKNVAYGLKIGGGTIAGIKEVNLLDAGAIGVFNPEGTLLTAANVVANIADRKGIIFAVGSGDATKGADITITTERIKTSYVKKAYVAPVKLKKIIGLDSGSTNGGSMNFPATLVEGTEGFFRITDTTPGLITTGTNIRRYSHVVRIGDTPTIILNDIIARINADTDGITVAAAGGANNGIELTAKNFGQTFAISLDGIVVSATIDEPESPNAVTAAVTINYGEGTSAKIGELEELFSTQLGNTNKVYQQPLWWKKLAKTVVGATYDSYVVSWMGRKTSTQGSNQYTVAHEIIIAMPPAATQQAAFEAVMAEVFGNEETEETGV